MDYSQNSTNADPEIGAYKVDSIPHTTAAEERVLWSKYIKWRHIKRILDSESVSVDSPKASSIVISRAIEEISSSHDLVVLLRRCVGIDKLGDTILEDGENNTNIPIELYRLIQHSKKKHGERIKQNNIEICCLEDLFGFIFKETLNNIAFGSGNPSLVDKIAKAFNRDPTYTKDKLFGLAVNRELLPRSITKVLSPKIPLTKLPNVIAAIPPDFVLNDYQSFILNIRSEGEKAFDRIIKSHLWLTVEIAQKSVNKDISLPLDDLIQEGNLGLIDAAERFHPTLGTRFMSYAHWWIYQKIGRAIADQARTIRIPVHMVDTINKLLNVSRHLVQEYGREPTAEEIGAEMELPAEKVREIIKVSQLPISLESLVSGAEDSHVGDSIEDHDALPLDDAASKQLLKEQIDEVLSSLTPREQRVIALRFGLEDGRSRTLEEVGQEFGVTRERIRQIEAKALRRLRHPSRSRKLKEYLE